MTPLRRFSSHSAFAIAGSRVIPIYKVLFTFLSLAAVLVPSCVAQSDPTDEASRQSRTADGIHSRNLDPGRVSAV